MVPRRPLTYVLTLWGEEGMGGGYNVEVEAGEVYQHGKMFYDPKIFCFLWRLAVDCVLITPCMHHYSKLD